ncbi:MAG: ABC transporter permease [Anaerolineaceae bacterium]|nr:ABC transporter permease [Anaerolineaceae bacterium]
MKTLLIAKKYLQEILREWQLILLILLIPIIFLLITYLIYPGEIIQTHPIHIQSNSDSSPIRNELISNIQEAKHPNGLAVFKINQETLDKQTIINRVEQNDFVLAIDLDESTTPPTITILGDPLSQAYYQAINALEFDGRSAENFITTEVVALYPSGPTTNFDFYAPGMVVFAMLLLTMQTAMLITREIKTGTIHRLKLSAVSGTDIVLGITLAQSVIVILQILSIGFLSYMLGFHIHGSIPLALLNTFILALSAIAQGLIVGCYLENDSQAATIGAIVPMVQVFVSGAFFEMPAMPLFPIGRHVFNMFDFFPATSSMNLFKLILSYNAPLEVLGFNFMLLIVLTVLTFFVAAYVFHRKLLRV